MNLPGGNGYRGMIGSVASPETLNQSCGRLPPANHVLLSLLLLYLQRKTRTQDALQREFQDPFLLTGTNLGGGKKEKTYRGKGEERNAEKGTKGGDDFPLPCHRDGISIAHSAQGNLRIRTHTSHQDTTEES